jgi:hypothetical protein
MDETPWNGLEGRADFGPFRPPARLQAGFRGAAAKKRVILPQTALQSYPVLGPVVRGV